MNTTNKDLKRKIVEISYQLKLSHLGSNLTAVDIIDEIYRLKKPDEKFVLSAGHAHLAHLVVRWGRINGSLNVEQLIELYGIHCDMRAGCDVSTGSLGHGLGIAVGMALADRSRNVYCLISDGECAEGSIYEALEVAEQYQLDNLKVHININGYSAYKKLDRIRIWDRLLAYHHWDFTLTDPESLPFLKALDAHYHVMTDEEYKIAMEALA